MVKNKCCDDVDCECISRYRDLSKWPGDLFDLIHLQKHLPMCNLGKKSHKDMVAENAACKHIRMMAKQY